MHDWSPERVAQAAGGATLGQGGSAATRDANVPSGPQRIVIDSRDVGPGENQGDVFVDEMRLGMVMRADAAAAAVIRHDDQQRMLREIGQHPDRRIDFHGSGAILR